MTDPRDEETEPMTRLLGLVVRQPREGEPQKRLIDLYARKPADQTRLELFERKPADRTSLEVARPKAPPTYVSSEPITQVVTSVVRPEGRPFPAPPPPFDGDPETPQAPIKPVFAPRLTGAERDEVTVRRRAPPRVMPTVLAIALAMLVIAGASLFRERARAAKRALAAAAQLEASRSEAPSPAAASAHAATAATELITEPLRIDPPMGTTFDSEASAR